MSNTSEFIGVSFFGKDTPNQMIKTSLMEFLNWGFLQIGAYVNTNLSHSGLYTGDASILRPVKDPNYTNGQVWEGARHNWVWESGLNNTQISISGVYVNGTFAPSSGVGAYSHIINYPLGRVIFNSPISTGNVVAVEHTYKWVSVVDADTIPFFQELQNNSLRIDTGQYISFASGDYFKIGNTRLQPPLVAVELPNRVDSYGAELGGATWVRKNILCHVISEDAGDTANKIADIISLQKEKVIYGIDTNKIAEDNRFPLNYNGGIASGALTYPQLCVEQEFGGYRWRKMYITDTEITSNQRLTQKLSISTVRLEIEVLLGIL
jgi:hypothetical protein